MEETSANLKLWTSFILNLAIFLLQCVYQGKY